jgi:hypothetical protein
MPRQNKRKTAKTEPHRHAPSPHSKGYKPECAGCAFVGFGSVCFTSDGKCLKAPLPTAREVVNAEAVRGANTASTER